MTTDYNALLRVDYLLTLCDQFIASKRFSPLRLDHISSPACDFLQTYTKQSIFDIIGRVPYFQQRALAVKKYRCILHNKFVLPRIDDHPRFEHEVLPVLRDVSGSPGTILDIGCCFGTDLRYCLHIGCTEQNIVGVDVCKEFIDLGFEFYRDRSRLEKKFITMDVLSADFVHRALKLNGDRKFDVISVHNLYHLLTLSECVKLTNCIAKLLKPKRGILFGTCVGCEEAGASIRKASNQSRYLHSKQSLKNLFEGCGALKQIDISTNHGVVQRMTRFKKPEKHYTYLNFFCMAS